MDFDARYKALNAAQREAVDTIDGPVMVIAGPGTGKTELLSMRTANILKKTDTLPENILCLTFTDSGADAMRARLTDIIGQDAYKVGVHTFHSFGAEIINQNSEFFFNGAAFTAADELESYEILQSIFDELDYTNPLASKMNGEYTHIKDMLGAISDLKRSGLTTSELRAILDANELVFDAVEKDFADIFTARMSKAALERLAPLIETISQLETPELPTDITPMATTLALSLSHALEACQELGKTTPLTAWKNQWFEKDSIGAFVFKSRKRQVKLRAAVGVYESYLARMQDAGRYDFDDMILQVVHAIETQPDLRFNLQEKYQFIMVDEFQDTNLAQARILHNLIGGEDQPNILVVGDDDQAIYAFQGADISNIRSFSALYPATKHITLTDNYRSAEPIILAARGVITQGTDRLETHMSGLDKSLTPHHTSPKGGVTLLAASSNDLQRQSIVEDITKRLKAGSNPQEIVVLARRHHELIALLPYFHQAGIATNYEKRDNALENETIMLVETVARLVLTIGEGRYDKANGLLPELLAHPAWGLTPQDLWKLSLTAYQERKSWLEIMEASPRFTELHGWLLELARRAPHEPLERLIDDIIGHGEQPAEGFVSPLFTYFFGPKQLENNPDAYLDHLEALRTLREKLRHYHPGEQVLLKDFVRFIELHRITNTSITTLRRAADNKPNAINLMTAHKSKGMEFETVYVIGATDKAWGEKARVRYPSISYPENLPLAVSGGSLDERLRLFFVAMTRAKDNLMIAYAATEDNGKTTPEASFLLPLKLTEKTSNPDGSAETTIQAAEREWYAPLVATPNTDLKQLLTPVLEHYKLSATHLNSFLDVSRGGPERFLMNNLLHFPSAMSPAAAFGSAIHSTLQRAHNHLKATGDQRPEEDILHDFERVLREFRLSSEELEEYTLKGSRTLQAFLAEKHDTFSRTQKPELSFGGQQVVLGSATLTGMLDLVDINETEKTMVVTDYKTGKPSLSWTGKTDYEKIKLHNYRQQLMFYKLLVEHSRDYGNYAVECGVLQFVEPTPSGAICDLELTFNAEELARFARLIEVVWRHITTLDLPDTSGYEPTFKGVLAFETDLLGE